MASEPQIVGQNSWLEGPWHRSVKRIIMARPTKKNQQSSSQNTPNFAVDMGIYKAY